MRQPLTFLCNGDLLAGTLHPAPGQTGVLIVSGGLQTRHGSHRGFVVLADRLAKAGFPVLRFDRRGVGDSDGNDPGFRGAGPDIAAAVVAMRRACPSLTKVIGWGLCDGAAALALHGEGFKGLMLANPWTNDSDGPDALPPSAAISAHYAARIISPGAWLRLLKGAVNLRALTGGLIKLARRDLISISAKSIFDSLHGYEGETLILLSERDATAQAFAALLGQPMFSGVARRATVATIAGATHTFPEADAENQMIEICLDWVSRLDMATDAGAT